MIEFTWFCMGLVCGWAIGRVPEMLQRWKKDHDLPGEWDEFGLPIVSTNTPMPKCKAPKCEPWPWPYCRRSHRMKLVKDTGPNLYYECIPCDYREVRHRKDAGYQPVDKEWLNNV